MRLKVTILAWVGVCLAAPTAFSDFKEVSVAKVKQTSLVIKSEYLHQIMRKPGLVLRDSGMLSNRDIWLSCIRYAHYKNTLLVYTPANNKCVLLNAHEAKTSKASLNPNLSVLSGESGLDQLLKDADIVAINPIPQGVPVQCVCDPPPPTNHAPRASVFAGSPQEVQSGAAIAPIEFRATDSDGDAMTHRYSFLFNDTPFDNLPAGLSEHCSTSPGFLSCILNGTSPGDPGDYQITMHVSDGSLADTATASLQVTPSETLDRVFINGFESAE